MGESNLQSGRGDNEKGSGLMSTLDLVSISIKTMMMEVNSSEKYSYPFGSLLKDPDLVVGSSRSPRKVYGLRCGELDKTVLSPTGYMVEVSL